MKASLINYIRVWWHSVRTGHGWVDHHYVDSHTELWCDDCGYGTMEKTHDEG